MGTNEAMINWWYSEKNKYCNIMNANTTSGLTPHFEIWFCHWSVIEYNQVLFHYIY